MRCFSLKTQETKWGGCDAKLQVQAASGLILVWCREMDSGSGFWRGYDAREEKGVEEDSGQKAGGFIAFQLCQLSLQSVLNKNLFISWIRPAWTTQLNHTPLRKMRWMLSYPAVPWLSNSLVQLERPETRSGNTQRLCCHCWVRWWSECGWHWPSVGLRRNQM